MFNLIEIPSVRLGEMFIHKIDIILESIFKVVNERKQVRKKRDGGNEDVT